MTSTFVGIDAGYENRWEAEKIALELHDTLLTTARTVVVHEVEGHHAMSFLVPQPPSDIEVDTLVQQGFGVAVRSASSGRLVGPEALRAGASAAAEAHQYRREGRALRFQGQRSLRGRHGVSDILAFTAIEAVLPRGTHTVDTRGNLTPFFQNGKLVLVVD
ncbi:hypothetical protein AB0A63_25960 [Lentzea sp. NPDC042327]|uniref:hypothetical protein n=1 Tax=Lentzea sp. NPDC042327 TaxID=3154801 RepID=UPI003400AD74